MSRTTVVYMAHPVGNGPTRPQNIRLAKLWFRSLVETVPHMAFSAPWLPYVETLNEDAYRDRGIRDDLEQLSRCDAVVLVGGRLSPGMAAELACARALDKRVIDLLALPGDPSQLGPEHRTRIFGAFRGIA